MGKNQKNNDGGACFVRVSTATYEVAISASTFLRELRCEARDDARTEQLLPSVAKIVYVIMH